MKQKECIFVEDGSPEASDYDNNFVCYDGATAGGYELAMLEVNRLRGTQVVPAVGIEPLFRLEAESCARGDLSGGLAVGVKQNVFGAYWGQFLKVCERLVAMAQRAYRINRRRASRRALFPTDRFLRRSREGFTFP
ncbi:MAG: hypothetical protein WCL44_03510 [bacterium]